jgi:hypothetical protein
LAKYNPNEKGGSNLELPSLAFLYKIEKVERT